MDRDAQESELRRLLARHLPGYEVASVVRLGEGLDNTAWDVNGELVLRQGKETAPDLRASAVRREAALLAVLSRLSPLPVPEPIFVDGEAGVLAYPRLAGLPLKRRSSVRPAFVAPALGELLDALHRAPVDELESLVGRDIDPLATWLDGAERDFEQIRDRLSPGQRLLVETFLGRTPPQEPRTLAFCHNDLGSEHVLVDPESSAITGIIDWSDAAIADLARDFALLYRDLGPEALDLMLTRYGSSMSESDRERVVFHARCSLIEDIAYGLTRGDSLYAESGLAHLERTFA